MRPNVRLLVCGGAPYLLWRLRRAVLLGMPFGLLAFERLDRGPVTIAFGVFPLEHARER